jgi:hypothetical protein
MSKFTFARPVPKKSAELDKNVDDAAGDLDGEGVSNLDEFLSGTDPNLADTDGDGLSDGTEGMEELRGDHRSQFLTINLVAIYLPLQRGSLRRTQVVTLSRPTGVIRITLFSLLRVSESINYGNPSIAQELPFQNLLALTGRFSKNSSDRLIALSLPQPISKTQKNKNYEGSFDFSITSLSHHLRPTHRGGPNSLSRRHPLPTHGRTQRRRGRFHRRAPG